LTKTLGRDFEDNDVNTNRYSMLIPERDSIVLSNIRSMRIFGKVFAREGVNRR